MKYKVGAGLILLAIYAISAGASGPYLPPLVGPRLESLSGSGSTSSYQLGQAMFNGNVKLGSGQACSGCHTGTRALNSTQLRRKPAEALQLQVEKCATQLDRGHGSVNSSQMQALMLFLKKRHRL